MQTHQKLRSILLALLPSDVDVTRVLVQRIARKGWLRVDLPGIGAASYVQHAYLPEGADDADIVANARLFHETWAFGTDPANQAGITESAARYNAFMGRSL